MKPTIKETSQRHEATAAAFEVRNAHGKVTGARGTLAVASAYREILAVYRRFGDSWENNYVREGRPTRLLEWFYAAKKEWVSAERRLQRLTLEQMVRMARANPRFYRVVVFDHMGRRIVLDAARTQLRGE